MLLVSLYHGNGMETRGGQGVLCFFTRDGLEERSFFPISLLQATGEHGMITQNEIEARMRQCHGSRRAMILAEASPPNSPSRYGRGVGPWGIPAGLSAALVQRGRYLLTGNSTFLLRERAVGRERVSTDFLFSRKKKRYGGHTL